MRLTHMIALLFCCLGSLLAQTASPPLGEIHTDPEDSKAGVRVALRPTGNVTASPEAVKILGELEAANGLDPQPQTPWHVQLTYDEFDDDGDNVHSGTIEEFYVTAKKYRTEIKTDDFHQIEIADGTNVYRSGDQGWPPRAAAQALQEVVSPIPGSNGNQDGSADKLDWKVGGAKLSCVVLRNGRILSDNGLPKFCYEPGTTVLRYKREPAGWNEAVFNSILQFDQRFIARDIEVTRGKPYLKIHVGKVEPLPSVDGALFSPSEGNVPLSGVLTVPSAVLMREYQFPREGFPQFPRGVKGKVTVKFTVNEEGKVVSAEAIDGPEELRKAAEQDVRKLRFRPFLILDKPYMVQSTAVYNIQ